MRATQPLKSEGGTQAFLPVRPAELHSAVSGKRVRANYVRQRVTNPLGAQAAGLCSWRVQLPSRLRPDAISLSRNSSLGCAIAKACFRGTRKPARETRALPSRSPGQEFLKTRIVTDRIPFPTVL